MLSHEITQSYDIIERNLPDESGTAARIILIHAGDMCSILMSRASKYAESLPSLVYSTALVWCIFLGSEHCSLYPVWYLNSSLNICMRIGCLHYILVVWIFRPLFSSRGQDMLCAEKCTLVWRWIKQVWLILWNGLDIHKDLHRVSIWISDHNNDHPRPSR